MNADLQTRIAAIKSQCEEILRLSGQFRDGPWGSSGNIVKNDVGFVADCYGDEDAEEMRARFIAKSSNVSPQMAKVILGLINKFETQGRDSFLEFVANQWEGK